jgi:CRP-like cAMP-binding protein
MHPTLDQLRAIALLADLPDEDLERIARWLDVEEHDPGHAVVGEGRAGYVFFFIERGRVEVRQDGRAVATLGEGEFFGEEAILSGDRRNADVIALEPTSVFSMFGTYFREFQAEQPELAEEIVRVVQARRDTEGAAAD